MLARQEQPRSQDQQTRHEVDGPCGSEATLHGEPKQGEREQDQGDARGEVGQDERPVLHLLLGRDEYQDVEGAGHAEDQHQVAEQREPPANANQIPPVGEGAVEVDPPQGEADKERQGEDVIAGDAWQKAKLGDKGGEALAQDDDDEQSEALPKVPEAQALVTLPVAVLPSDDRHDAGYQRQGENPWHGVGTCERTDRTQRCADCDGYDGHPADG